MVREVLALPDMEKKKKSKAFMSKTVWNWHINR